MSNIKVVKFIDNIASYIIKSGGVIVISCVALIIFMIFKVAFPLFLGSSITLSIPRFDLVVKEELAEIGLSEYLDSYFTISKSGHLRIYELNNQKKSENIILRDGDLPILKINRLSKDIYSVYWQDGNTRYFKVSSVSILENGKRINRLKFDSIATISKPFLVAPAELASSINFEKGEIIRLYTDNKKIYVNVFKFDPDESDVNISESTSEQTVDNNSSDKTFMSLSANGEQLWVAIKSGQISRFVRDEEEFELKEKTDIKEEITAIGGIYGDVSLIVAQSNGEVNSWISVRPNNNSKEKFIVKSHSIIKPSSFSKDIKPIVKIRPSFKDKTFLAATKDGELYQSHLTTDKTFFYLGKNNIRLFALDPKAKGLIAIVNDQVLIYSINNPYHEVSFAVLFNKIWYEGYSEPQFVWQSGSGGDDGETKLSLTPLIFGTLKGTFYAMLLSIPLALGSAVYISQFAAPSVRSLIKPAVEMMSAIPSVVVGFIAALWLAPKVDGNFLLIFLSLPVFTILFFLTLLIWSKFASDKIRKSAEHGFRLFYIMPSFLVTFVILYVVCPWLEEVLFQGSFKLKLIDYFNIKGYEQRNCLIIGFALGFAVIPIIFTIAEDVLSTVPRSLTANSLALGANRWQTVWRIIIPSASPGIIAGVIIGFGRAIGETMIVLMATGNTPIMDFSIFNGMRTLSANVAVEIGEAPVDGTLYRTLFLSAVILFLMTFILNTGAELIRQALRKKYSQF